MTARMTYGAHVKAILALGLPLIGSHVAQFAVQMTDTFMLGWYDVRVLVGEALDLALRFGAGRVAICGSLYLAGEVLGGTLFFILFIAGSGFAWAVSPLVASAEGAGDTTTARRVTRMSLWISALYACATLPLLLNADTILLALGQEPELARIADDYLSITA